MRRVLRFILVLGLSCTCVSGAVTAAVETRVALVIGNAAYEHAGRLNNPVNDARAIAAALERIGFAVTALEDQAKPALEAALKAFARQARGADVALVYYSGHGMEIGGANYLVPIDAALESDVDIDFEAVALDSLLRVVEGAKRLRVVILDACRNNPLAAQMQVASATRGIGRGLARVEPAGQTLVAYAAKAGTVADDGAAEHSPYTEALLRHLEEPGLDVRFLFARVRDDVLAATSNEQEPFTYGSLGAEQQYFVPPVPVEAAAAPPPSPLVESGGAAEVSFWESIKDSGDAAMFEAYLEQFPNGTFAKLARLKIAALQAVSLPVASAAGAEAPEEQVAALPPAEVEPAPSQPNKAPLSADLAPIAVTAGGGRLALAVLPPDDPDGDPLTLRVTEVPSVGTLWSGARALAAGDTLSLSELASLAYEPPGEADRTGFALEAADGRGGVAVVRAEMEITPAPEPIVAAPDTAAEPPAGPEPAAVREAQQRLKTLGYALGSADGKLGPKPRAAIRAFQEQAGLAVDGEVSAALLAALNSNGAPAAPPPPKPEPAPAATASAVAPTPTAPVRGEAEGTEDALFWQSIQASKDPADFEDYLARFPDGAFSSLAKRRLAALSAAVGQMSQPDAAAAPADAADACPTFDQWRAQHPTVYPTGPCASLGSRTEVFRCTYQGFVKASGCRAGPTSAETERTASATGDARADKVCPTFAQWQAQHPSVYGTGTCSSLGSKMEVSRCLYRRSVESSGCKPAP